MTVLPPIGKQNRFAALQLTAIQRRNVMCRLGASRLNGS
jgi:hypothetical protein